MPIRVPVDGHLITLNVVDYQIVTRRVQVGPRRQVQRERVRTVREVPPRFTEASVHRAIDEANAILAPTNVSFELRNLTSDSIEMPSSSDTVDRPGFLYLANHFPASNAASLLLVSNFASTDLGGEALEERSVCIVAFIGEPLLGKVLAHEFGHLLSLEHVEGDVQAHYNLMYPGLSADTQLTEAQQRQARESPLVRRFGQGSNQ